jgi:hypothetical protein
MRSIKNNSTFPAKRLTKCFPLWKKDNRRELKVNSLYYRLPRRKSSPDSAGINFTNVIMHLYTKHFLTIGFNFQVPQTTNAIVLNPRENPVEFQMAVYSKNKRKAYVL